MLVAALLAFALGAAHSLAQTPATPTAPGDLELIIGLVDKSGTVIRPDDTNFRAEARLKYSGEAQRLVVSVAGQERGGRLTISSTTNPPGHRPAFEVAQAHRHDIPEQTLAPPEMRLAAPGGLSNHGRFGRAVASDDAHFVVAGGGRVGVYRAVPGVRVVTDGPNVRLEVGGKVRDLTPPTGADAASFGASVAVNGDFVFVGAPMTSVTFTPASGATDDANTANDDESVARTVDNAGSVYIFKISDGSHIATLKPDRATSFGAMTDTATDGIQFGASVSVSDDGTLLVVGAPLATPSSSSPDLTNAGAAYIFTKPADTPGVNPGDSPTPNPWVAADATSSTVTLSWSMTPTTTTTDTPPVTTTDEVGFGTAVAISGDGKVIAVGAPKTKQSVTVATGGTPPTEDRDVENVGAVLVFTNSSGTWASSGTAIRLDVEPNPDADATVDDIKSVGRAVSISNNGQVIVASGAGDLPVDPDGTGPMPAPDPTWKGAAFVWEGPAPADMNTAPVWTAAAYATARLVGSDSAAGDRFGAAVAVNDAGDKVLVSDSEASRNTRQGGVYVFSRPTDGWDNRKDTTQTPPQPMRTAAVVIASNGVAEVAATGGPPPTMGGFPEIPAAVYLPPQVTRDEGFYGAALGWVETPAGTIDPAPAEGNASYLVATRLVVGQPENSAVRTVAENKRGNGAAYLLSSFDASSDSTCSVRDNNGVNEYTCWLDLGDTRIDNGGATDGDNFRIAGTVTVYGSTVTKNFDVRVTTITELHSVALDLPSGQSRSVQGGDSVNLILRIKNQENRPTDPTFLTTVLITAAGGGTLSSPAGGASCSGVSCQLDISKLHATGNTNRTDNISLTWIAPTARGGKTIRVTATGPEGVKTASRGLTVIGSARSLSIAAAGSSLYYRPTRNDNRDVARLEVTAKDADDRTVTPPTQLRSWDVKLGQSSDGQSVKSQFSLKRSPETGQRNGKVHLELSVTGTDLEPGFYLLEATLGTARGSRRITISGAPATISIEDEGSRLTGGSLTFTATVRDSRRAAVADGTPVTFTPVATPNVVLAPAGADRATTGGRASARYVVVATGRAVIRICAVDTCDVKLIGVGGGLPGGFGGSGGGGGSGGSGGGGGGSGGGGGGGAVVVAPPPPPPEPHEQLSRRALDALITWQGARTVRGSALLDSVTEAGAVFYWTGREWLPYGRANGVPLPGSIDFVAAIEGSLWFTGPSAPAAAAPEGEDGGGEDGESDDGEDGSSDNGESSGESEDGESSGDGEDGESGDGEPSSDGAAPTASSN